MNPAGTTTSATNARPNPSARSAPTTCNRCDSHAAATVASTRHSPAAIASKGRPFGAQPEQAK